MNKSVYSFITGLLLTLLSGCAYKPLNVSESTLADNADECVVLIHGLWRSGIAMRMIANDLEDYGFHSVRIDYPSTKMEIPELAEEFIQDGINRCEETGANQIHLVTHSMGGILARQYLQDHSLPEGSRVVMLSPPNQGSDFSNKFGEMGWYQWLIGPAGTSLTQNGSGIINQLAEVQEPVGIIASYRNWNPWPESWLASPNDGLVSLRNMMLKEMDDVILVNSGHAMVRYKDETHRQIRHFLKRGKFDRTPISEDMAVSQAL